MQRRVFIKNAGMAGGMFVASPLLGNVDAFGDDDFPLMDLHVHTTSNFTIDSIMDIARRTNVQFGVVENPGMNVRDDASLKKYIDKLRPYPVYIGLQPMSPGWSGAFSPEVLSQLDYVIMDAQTVPMGNGYGETLRIWNFDTYVDDTNRFMETYMAHTMEVLNNNEPINVFGWPLFLPVCIARDYYALWTEERMQRIISAAKGRSIAIEINDMAHTPHEKFINMAKEQGVKFTFGSDTRDLKAGRLAYCREIARKCGLKRDNFYIPARKIEGVAPKQTV
jgi:histidinol phosphatase-like PHP family hydrolase